MRNAAFRIVVHGLQLAKTKEVFDSPARHRPGLEVDQEACTGARARLRQRQHDDVGFQVGALSGCGQEVYGPYLVHLGASTSLLPGGSAVFQERCLAAVLRKLGVGERCSIVGLGHGGSFAFEMGHDTPGPRLLRGRLWR